MIKGVIVTNLKVIDAFGGDVMHVMKESSIGYSRFGEAYFSKVNEGAIKAWKRHKEMTLNIVVPVGKIKFILFDDREVSNIQFQEVVISGDNYCRLTIPPMVWVGFQGISNSESMLLNIANRVHEPSEIDRLDVDKINYDWSVDI